MQSDQFEWDDEKAAENHSRHGISFETAIEIFKDPFAVERLDDREDYGEERFVLIGMAETWCSSWPTRNGVSASGLFRRGGRQGMSKTTTSNRTTKPIRAMTSRQVLAAAHADPDARPLRPADLKRMKRTPQVKIIRRALGLSQEEFAARYRIPVGTVRDWEQGRAVPDAAARAYLRVIAREPDTVRRALTATQSSAA